jgi:hypothetical protein
MNSGSIVIRDLEGREEPWKIYSVKGSIVWESNLKPVRDRLYLTGFDAIKEPDKRILKDGFQAVYRDTWRRFKTESYFMRNIEGIERMYLRALRYEDWFLDQVYQKKFPRGKFSSFLQSIMGKIPYTVVSSLGDKEIEISPYKGATRREILYQLSKELNFLWTLKMDYGVAFFTMDESPGELFNPNINFNLSSMTRTPNGWLASDRAGIPILPGTLLQFKEYQDEKIRISSVTNVSYIPASDGIVYYRLIEPDIENVTYADLRISMDSRTYPFNVEKEPVYPMFDVDILKRQENYMLKGDRGNISGRKDFIKLQPLTKETVTNIDDLSPWATMDGFGMAFPRQDKLHVSVTAPITPIKSVRVGDVLHDVWNKEGEAFHLKLPEGFLFYEVDNDLLNKMTPPNLYPDGVPEETAEDIKKYQGSAWKMKAWSGVTIAAGGEKSTPRPSTVPLPEDENYLSILAGGQANLEVQGLNGPYSLLITNFDESKGGGGVVSIGSKKSTIQVGNDSSGNEYLTVNVDNVSFFDVFTSKISLGSARINLGENANDPVVRQSDLQSWITSTFDTHTHPTAPTGPVSPPSNVGSTANGSSKVYSE